MRDAVGSALDGLGQIFEHAVTLHVAGRLVYLSHHFLQLFLLQHLFLLATLLGQSLHAMWRVLGLIVMLLLLSVIDRPLIFRFRLLNAHYLVFCGCNVTLERVRLVVCSGAATLIYIVLVVLCDYLGVRWLFRVNMINNTRLLSDYDVCART